MGAGQRFFNNLRASNWRLGGEERVNDSWDQSIHMYRMQAATATNAGFCRVRFILMQH